MEAREWIKKKVKLEISTFFSPVACLLTLNKHYEFSWPCKFAFNLKKEKVLKEIPHLPVSLASVQEGASWKEVINKQAPSSLESINNKSRESCV